eukprot:symbB.v1.2.018686.t1/scaffold1410.1/size216244/12
MTGFGQVVVLAWLGQMLTNFLWVPLASHAKSLGYSAAVLAPVFAESVGLRIIPNSLVTQVGAKAELPVMMVVFAGYAALEASQHSHRKRCGGTCNGSQEGSCLAAGGRCEGLPSAGNQGRFRAVWRSVDQWYLRCPGDTSRSGASVCAERRTLRALPLF